MIKQSIIIPILIVIVIILLILSFAVLFTGRKNSSPESSIGTESEIKQPDKGDFIPSPIFEQEADDFIEEFNSAEKVPYTYTLANGEEYIIKIPMGIDPPPQAVVEKMYRMENSR